MLISKLEEVLSRSVEQTGIKKTRLLIEAGIDPAQMNQAMRGKRPFSESLLKALADSQNIDVSYGQLIAWGLVDEYGMDVVKEASRIVEGMEKED